MTKVGTKPQQRALGLSVGALIEAKMQHQENTDHDHVLVGWQAPVQAGTVTFDITTLTGLSPFTLVYGPASTFAGREMTPEQIISCSKTYRMRLKPFTVNYAKEKITTTGDIKLSTLVDTNCTRCQHKTSMPTGKARALQRAGKLTCSICKDNVKLSIMGVRPQKLSTSSSLVTRMQKCMAMPFAPNPDVMPNVYALMLPGSAPGAYTPESVRQTEMVRRYHRTASRCPECQYVSLVPKGANFDAGFLMACQNCRHAYEVQGDSHLSYDIRPLSVLREHFGKVRETVSKSKHKKGKSKVTQEVEWGRIPGLQCLVCLAETINVGWAPKALLHNSNHLKQLNQHGWVRAFPALGMANKRAQPQVTIV